VNDYVVLVAGVVAAAIGGELFVRGSVGLALWARISPGIVGASVAAFATSSPELSVSISAASAGSPQLSLGDVLGSNVVNVALILGLALSMSGIRSPRSSVRRDFPVALLVPVVTGVLMLDGVLSRADGFLLLGIFLLWLGATVAEARRERGASAQVLGESRILRAAVSCALGLVLLFLAGYLIVRGARGVAAAFGIDAFLVGATIVAVGTSVPELATTLVSKLRGHDEVGLGTILGSNIFNGLLVVAVAAIICPIGVRWQEVGVALVFGVVAVATTYPTGTGLIERRRGFILLVLYAAYLVAVAQGAS
jgi:cation:H+ antiporter